MQNKNFFHNFEAYEIDELTNLLFQNWQKLKCEIIKFFNNKIQKNIFQSHNKNNFEDF